MAQPTRAQKPAAVRPIRTSAPIATPEAPDAALLIGSRLVAQRARVFEGLQRHQGNAYVARLVQRAIAAPEAPEAPPQKLEPQQDPKFIAVQHKIGQGARHEKEHASARSKAAQAQGAAKAPPNDIASQAAAAQVDKMAQQKPGDFDKKGFIEAVKKAIDAAAPKNMSEAVDFKESGKAGQVKGQVASLVSKDKQQSESGIKQTSTEAPDASKARPKQVIAMGDEKPGPVAGDPGAKQAIPSPKPASETSMAAGPAAVNQQMADAEVTEQQLKDSNEPEFTDALGAKKVAEDHSQKAPEDYRATEQEVLAKAGADARGASGAGLQGMHGVRVGLLGAVSGHKAGARGQDEARRAEIAARIESIFNQTRTEVTAILSALDGKVTAAFDAGEQSARSQFETYVDQQMSAYKKKRYKGLRGKYRWVRDKLRGMPDEVNAFYTDGRNRYLNQMEKVIGNVADVVAAELGRAKLRIAQGKEQVKQYVESQPKALRQIAREAEEQIGGKFEQLEGEVESKQDALVQTLATRYVAARDSLDQRIDELKAANKGLIDKVVDAVAGVIRTIMHLKDMLLNVLSKAAGVIGEIIKHPIKFLGNLVGAIKQGLNQFVSNIGTHLEKALVSWLFGTLGDAGIELPESLDLKGIVSLVLQVLGLTYANIRSIAAKLAGEKVVSAVEGTAKFFVTLASEGPGALWQWIQDKIADLNLEDMVIGAIKDFVITRIITAGVTWLLSMLNPASAFIKACKMIYDVIMFFIERGSQIMEFVNTVLDSVGAIAAGNIGSAAALVENSLAKLLPLAISFLASLLGVGGIAEKIKDIIEKIRAPINKLISSVLGSVLGPIKKLYDKGAKFVKGVVDKGKALGQKAIGKLKGKFYAGTEDDKQQRLVSGMSAAKSAVNKYAGKAVGLAVLKPLVAGVRLRNRLPVLEVVPNGPRWAVHGEIARIAEDTDALHKDGTPADDDAAWKKVDALVAEIKQRAGEQKAQLDKHRASGAIDGSILAPLDREHAELVEKLEIAEELTRDHSGDAMDRLKNVEVLHKEQDALARKIAAAEAGPEAAEQWKQIEAIKPQVEQQTATTLPAKLVEYQRAEDANLQRLKAAATTEQDKQLLEKNQDQANDRRERFTARLADLRKRAEDYAEQMTRPGAIKKAESLLKKYQKLQGELKEFEEKQLDAYIQTVGQAALAFPRTTGERIAWVKAEADKLAERHGWEYDPRLSKLNGRPVYYDPFTKKYQAVDTETVTFEQTKSSGTWEGERNFNLNFIDLPFGDREKVIKHSLKLREE
jgi:hypothetical protein